ncbi:DUF4238 domain-containing protein [Pseudomonas sp. LS44]|uniref:DUF4238 domain-containing protein n=1 Tax=Pseudomonas sp. LS44 TaxID=1357074 RepID=UPI00215B5FDB|nr:DUF4238 domain-containing protein [Pseudomonas sp. LS44]UVE18190.1 DUF4238 domain-containing protein [Pseudomonas sp. LS44]
MTAQQTHDNHYVPVWYQKRFLQEPNAQIYRLDLTPPVYHKGPARAINKKFPKSFFYTSDLYTTWPDGQPNDEIERLLFGDIDNEGAVAVRQMAEGKPEEVHSAFESFFAYIAAQKMRTPKGLEWIKQRYSGLDQNGLMTEMQYLLHLNLTLWSEGVREIVSAKDSDVKFIVTDHPVTLYNAACPPDSQACIYPNEPAAQWNGTQTIFALDANHCLIISHLDYANQKPGLDLLADRQNSRHLGRTIVNTLAWVRTRSLSREAVVAVNYLLKSRAHRYVAAAAEEWLFPEQQYSGDWAGVGEVLRPPSDELWHFGGEIYVGYQDGSTDYQDPYGRTSGSHEYLKKESKCFSIQDGDECGCGSGRTFEKCCKELPEAKRPSWSVASIRERNLMFIRAVRHILGLDSRKDWNDIRTELCDEHIVQIYKTLQGIWPPDTNFRELWPRPDPRTFRAVFMGCIDPRTVVASVLAWTSYFDEIIVLNPFQNPACIRPEYNPIHNPGQYKTQTLKNVLLLMFLEPFIEAGIVHLVPDPGELNYTFGKAMRYMAEARSGNPDLCRDETGFLRRLADDDLDRAHARLPHKALSNLIRRRRPELGEAEADQLAHDIQKSRADDPLALLQPVEQSQLMVCRCSPLEFSMFMAQVTGAAVYTDLPVFWRQLNAAAQAGPSAACWERFTAATEQLPFALPDDHQQALQLRTADTFLDVRRVFRSLLGTLIAPEGDVAVQAEQLALEAEEAFAAAQERWRTEISPGFALRLRLSVPEGGAAYAPAQRLVLTYGPDNALQTVPMALLVDAP